LGTNPSNDHKCTLPRIDADWLENELWQRVKQAVESPEYVRMAIDDYIAKLGEIKAELEAQINPAVDRIKEVRRQLGRLAEAWVEEALGEDKVQAKKAQLAMDLERLEGVARQQDPTVVERLGNTSKWLAIWQDIKEEGIEPQIVMTPESDDVTWTDDEISFHIARLTHREWLDRLQVKAYAYAKYVVADALVPMPSIVLKGYEPGYRLSHCPRFQ